MADTVSVLCSIQILLLINKSSMLTANTKDKAVIYNWKCIYQEK